MKDENRDPKDDEHLRAVTDIVERLRDGSFTVDLCREAADVIERTREQLAECAARLVDAGLTIEQLWSENRALKDKHGD